MKLAQAKLLTDENVDPAVVEFLRRSGFDVVEGHAIAARGASDEQVIQAAASENRVVVTHDRDFGRLVIAAKQPFVGILFLRPGHLSPSFTIESLQTLLRQNPELQAPFVVVLARLGRNVHVRIRQPIL